jgi:hypothetical protein
MSMNQGSDSVAALRVVLGLQILAGLAFATVILYKATRNYLRLHRA